MNQRRKFLYIAFLLTLAAAGGGLLQLCSRFAGFRHPLTTPALLVGVCAVSGFLLLLMHKD